MRGLGGCSYFLLNWAELWLPLPEQCNWFASSCARGTNQFDGSRKPFTALCCRRRCCCWLLQQVAATLNCRTLFGLWATPTHGDQLAIFHWLRATRENLARGSEGILGQAKAFYEPNALITIYFRRGGKATAGQGRVVATFHRFYSRSSLDNDDGKIGITPQIAMRRGSAWGEGQGGTTNCNSRRKSTRTRK